MKRKRVQQQALSTKSNHVFFIDPTNRPITRDNRNVKYINDNRFTKYMYELESIKNAFRQGEFKSFGFNEWKDVEKILQPAKLPEAILEFDKDNSDEDKNCLDSVYISPIKKAFPRKNPFICGVDGESYSESDYCRWFAIIKRSPMNRSSVDLSNDLFRDSFAEAILDSYRSEVKDLEKIFSSWRQPPIQSYDINALNLSPFLGYEYFVLFFGISLIIHYDQEKQVDVSSAPYLMASLFITMEKFRKLQDILLWSVRRNEALTNLDVKFFMFNHTLMTSIILILPKLVLKLLPIKALSKDALSMINNIFKIFEFNMLFPHIRAWNTFCSKRQNILADVRKLFSGLINSNYKTKALITMFVLGTPAVIVCSSRFPDSLELLYKFDFASCSIAFAPTFILPMLDYTVRQIEKNSYRHESKSTGLQTVKKFLWPFIIAISAFIFTLIETKNPLCAFSTAIIMAFSINIENSVIRYNKISGNRYILRPLNENDLTNTRTQSIVDERRPLHYRSIDRHGVS